MRNNSWLLRCSAKPGFIWADLDNFPVLSLESQAMDTFILWETRSWSVSKDRIVFPKIGDYPSLRWGWQRRFCPSAGGSAAVSVNPSPISADKPEISRRGFWKSDSPLGTLGEWQPHDDAWLHFLTRCGSLGMPGDTRTAPSMELGSLVACVHTVHSQDTGRASQNLKLLNIIRNYFRVPFALNFVGVVQLP